VNVDWFVDRAEESGLKFRHVNGTEGKFYYAEVIAPGAAVVDYDNDGDLDVFLVQSGSLSRPGTRDSGSGIRGSGPTVVSSDQYYTRPLPRSGANIGTP